jgi:Kef-type K+ transport system membrane component KefB
VDNSIVQLAIILTSASVLGLIVLKLKLPLVVSYILTGVLLSLVSVFDTTHSLVLEVLPEIGIAFVLFLIGMELDLREIKTLGIPIIISAMGQIIVSTFTGYVIAGALGFNSTESLYLGLGLAFSSTVVVVKMLLEKRDLASLHGKLSIGILLVEDLVAVAVLMIISVSSSALNLGLQQNLPIFALILKALGLFLLTFVLSRYVLEKLFDLVAKSTELLFFTTIAWCFAFTALAVLSGFSVEIGAFLAGVALASSPYHFQIQGKIKPLRDFFLTLFFVYLGSQVRVDYILTTLPAILIFTLCAIILKPLIYMLILGRFGFRKHTLFQTALNLSQISEFSLIVLVVGVNAGLLTQVPLSIMASVAVLSIISSSILISLSNKLYKVFRPLMPFFEHKRKIHFLERNNGTEFEKHVIIIGAHRTGGPVVRYLQKAKIPFVVMDFNPHLVNELREKGMNVIYGDIGDPEVLDNLQIDRAKLIISTASSMSDNEVLLEECRKRKTSAVIIVRAEDKAHGDALKALGADYILSPETVAGIYLVNKIKTHWPRA